MGTVTNFLLCSIVVVIAHGEVSLEDDRPFLRVALYDKAVLECCYISAEEMVDITWFKHVSNVTIEWSSILETQKDKTCGILPLMSVSLNDTGLYRCLLNFSAKFVYTPGTYLHVYKPLEKTINLTESTKNNILTAEGVLLLLCVLVPSATLLCQSKKLNELQKKKVNKEEENIYQGLNLDDCCTTYDQIERSQAHGPYQDVCNIMEEEEEIQLEKP